jgi:bisphosphoglycerate-independent phosphoglycerate mutase (AlkP superfamily)
VKAKAVGKLHLVGLVSDGGVHSHQEHLYELLKGAKEAGVPQTVVHCIMDGRDTPPKCVAPPPLCGLTSLFNFVYNAQLADLN